MENNFSFIFLGLTHGFIDDFDKQYKLIKEINPEIVLSEEMENIELKNILDYESFLKNKKHSLMTSFKDVENLVNLCKKNKIKLIGFDLKNFGFSEKITNKINNNLPLSKLEEKEIENIVLKREFYQIKKIKEFQNKSKKSILVFLGSWHLRKESPLLKEISNSKIIFPVDKKGNLIFEPKEGEIKFIEKIYE